MTNSENNSVFEALLEYLRRTRGFDFTGYKRSSLVRRVQKRMQELSITNFEGLLDYLEVHPDEFTYLFNTILINVTAFFRDPPAWEYLVETVLPRILESKPTDPIRIWSAGCASGEEAYTLAMIMAEELGVEQFRQRVKIYATDVDEEALVQARLASYTTKALLPVPAELREKYFESIGTRHVFRTDLRRSVIFGRHDLMQDAPISRLDLLVCRNALMYFNAEAQTRILNRFHFALNELGFLFLGKAEMLLTHADLFSPTSLKHRVFTKVVKTSLRERLLVLGQQNDDQMIGTYMTRLTRLRESAFETVALAQIVISLDGILVLANNAACVQFGIVANDIGRPIQDLPLSYRPLELRSHIDQVYHDRCSITIADVRRDTSSGATQYLDVQFTPLQHQKELLGCSITFQDVTRYHHLQRELQRSNQELETANEELQSSNEELETTNEELQSTNEELETTNEELQATNEELETINEELQSTNEELEATNEEMRQRTGELNNTNAFLESILASLRAGVVVLDRSFRILAWNNSAEDLWGLHTNEVREESFFSLDIGLPVDQLRVPLRDCLHGESLVQESIVLSATNRRGRAIQCRVSYYPLLGSNQERQGLILLMEEI